MGRIKGAHERHRGGAAPKGAAVSLSSKSGLVQAAAQARNLASAPYSRFKVGAALLTESGKTITGINVESASYGLTCCAERVGLFNALTQGENRFVAIAVVARAEGGPMPCGACRQLLAEYAPGIIILSADARDLGRIYSYTIQQLLPAPFVQVPDVQQVSLSDEV